MKFVKNRPWKEWKTRKITLVGTIVFVLIYTGIGLLLCLFDHSIDSTLTEQFFSFSKWLVVTGCVITITKVVIPDSDACNEDTIEEELGDGE